MLKTRNNAGISFLLSLQGGDFETNWDVDREKRGIHAASWRERSTVLFPGRNIIAIPRIPYLAVGAVGALFKSIHSMHKGVRGLRNLGMWGDFMILVQIYGAIDHLSQPRPL